MDANIEDKMYHQIQKNLSNHYNDNLFTSGSTYEVNRFDSNNNISDDTTLLNSEEDSIQEANMDLPENMDGPIPLSRAEYIRQAREACLRQMSIEKNIVRDVPEHKREVFHTSYLMNSSIKPDVTGRDEENQKVNPKELAAFRFLIIRIVCALVIFAAIFIIDRFKIKLGYVTYETVRQFITGNDMLVKLENLIVSLFK